MLAADACTDAGLHVAQLGSQVQQEIRRWLPAGAEVTGPVNTTATVAPENFRRCLELIAADDGVDAILALAVPTAGADLAPAMCSANVAKPVALVLLDQADAVRLLPSQTVGRVPAYAYPKSAARALGHAARYGAWRAQPPGRVPEFADLRPDDARALIHRFLEHAPDGGWLPPAQVATLLECYGIGQVPTYLVATEQGAVEAADQLSGPAVLKADVPGLVHKTDASAVQLDLHGDTEVRAGYRALATRFGDRMTAVLVQPMITGGTEVIIGVVHDAVFGPLVVFGLGGVATDVLADQTARLTPLTETDSAAMIRSIDAAPLLLGHRGAPAADLAALQDLLQRVARLADDLGEVAELDLNPVIARPDGSHVVDARIHLRPGSAQRSVPAPAQVSGRELGLVMPTRFKRKRSMDESAPAQRPIGVFLLDDHEIVRRGVKDLLETDPGIVVVGEAGTAAAALARIPALRPDVAVLDVRLPDGDGVTVCREIRSKMPSVACLMLTSFSDDEALFDAIMAGAAGYVLKQIRGTDLVGAVRTVAAGESMLDPEAASRVMRRMRDQAARSDPLAGLTVQERKILELIGEGLTNRQIGERLFLAEKTVKNYVSALFAKLGMERRTQAAAYAARIFEDHGQPRPQQSGH